jgi:hypothetical protein
MTTKTRKIYGPGGIVCLALFRIVCYDAGQAVEMASALKTII